MRICWLVALLLLSACSHKPLQYSPDDPVDGVPANWQAWREEAAGSTDILGLVADSAIGPWMDRALQDNLALRQSLLALAQAEWTKQSEAAAGQPEITLTSDAQRVRGSGDTADISNQFGLGLTSRWEWDVWRRLADQVQAADWEASAQLAEYAYAKRSLSANFLKRWLAWVNAKQSLSVASQRLDTLTFNETVVQQRYQAGLGSLQDLETARADKEQATAGVSEKQALVNDSLREVQRLLGQSAAPQGLPEQWPSMTFPLLSLPAQSLGQRPDLMAAYQRIKAADSRSLVAYKQLLPSFSFSLDITRNASRGSDLLSSDPGWLLLGGLTQPLFQGGRLRAELRLAQQRAAQAYWAYREALLNALLEVETALDREGRLAEQHAALSKAHRFAQLSQANIEQRYRQGLATVLDLLRVQQTTYDIHSRLLQVALDRAHNRIDLGLALGLPVREGTEQ